MANGDVMTDVAASGDKELAQWVFNYARPVVGLDPVKTWAEGEDASELAVLQYVIADGFQRQSISLEGVRERPFRRRGWTEFSRIDSFVAYVNRHKDSRTQIYGSEKGSAFKAVINDHGGPELPGWGDFGATVQLVRSPEWLAWLKAATPMGQRELAQFLEERMTDIAAPDFGEFFETITDFKASRNVQFDSKFSVTNGQVQINYQDIVNDQPSGKHNARLPEQVTLLIEPYRGIAKRTVMANLRWQFMDRTPVFWFVIVDREQIERDVNDKAAEQIFAATEIMPLWQP